MLPKLFRALFSITFVFRSWNRSVPFFVLALIMFVFGANQTRGGLGRVCANEMYSFIELVEFPKFQTGIFVEWKALLNFSGFSAQLLKLRS